MNHVIYTFLLVLLSTTSQQQLKSPAIQPQPYEREMCAYPAMYRFVGDGEEVFTREQGSQLDSIVAAFYDTEKILINIYTTDTPLRFKDFDEFVYTNIKTNEFERHGIDKWILVSMSNSSNEIRINRSKALATVFTDESLRKLTAGCFRPEIAKGNFYEGPLRGVQGLIGFWESNK